MSWTERPPDRTIPLDAAADACRTDAARVLVAGWSRLYREACRVPSKSGLDPSAFAGALPHVALCAVRLGRSCVWRIAGEGLKERLGFDPSGRDYYDFVPPERRLHATRAMDMVVAVPSGFRAEIVQRYSGGRVRSVEAVGLPLLSAETGVDGFIVFADQALPATGRQDADASRMLGANVVRRDLIDIGFGVDEGFRDLVRIG
jgi:hypothetical protein